MKPILPDSSLDQIFREARSQNAWQSEDISDALIYALYDLLRMGPTSANCSPARFVFLKSADAKARIKPFLAENNIDKVLKAPVCVIIGHDLAFYEKLPALFPHNPDAKDWFSGDAQLAATIAMRNGSLQGAYLMIAARALGLDCGPMSGFDNDGVDQEFFPDGQIKSNFICALGVGDPKGVFERLPRLSFDEACELI